MDRLEFAAARRSALDDAESLIRSDVHEALGLFPQPHWMNPILDVAGTVAQESGGVPSNFRTELMHALTHQKVPGPNSEDFLVRWVATLAVNAGTLAAQDGTEDLEWVSMHDSHVRPTHQVADGQVKPPGEKFTVGTSKMRFPGDPTAPIEEWAGCRCVLRPKAVQTALVAAGGAPELSVIVALPDQDSPVHDVGPEQKHMTLLFLGPSDSITPDALDSIKGEIGRVASESAPYTDSVSGTAELGSDKAQVLLMDGEGAVAHRNALADQPSIMSQVNSVDQFPTFIPHVTLGYPDDDVQGEPPSTITFDRLALWHGDEQTEFPLGEAMTAPTEAPAEIAAATSTPWHGVLVPEGVASGDKRTFASDSLSHRPLPMPLTWQKFSDDRHKGSVTVGSIDSIERVGNEMRGAGRFLNTPEADEVVGQLAHFGRFGVSVDVDSAAFDLDEATQAVTFTAARISSASVVAIPAFAEAYIALGPWPTAGDNPVDDAANVAQADAFAVSDAPWDGSSSRFSPVQWRASCVLHKSNSLIKTDHGLPIKEPNGTLNRAAVHNAAGRINQVKGWPMSAVASAKRSLRGAYSQLGETPPDSLAAAGEVDTLDALHEEFARGAGWITHPEDTRRIHSYWTTPGQPGFAKIDWGVPGDFDRCRAEVGKYLVASGEPEFVNQTCALWHHDAIGIWPGQEDGGKSHAAEGEQMVGVSLVASAPEVNWVPKREWFSDPALKMPTPITYIDYPEGTRCVGHLAEWSDCHIGYPGVCVAPPHSLSDYVHFHLGSVITDDGIVRVGQITLGGGHADRRLGMRAAMAHYDDVCTAVCDVVVGEDQFGIWFSGWVRPSASEQQRYELRAAKLSGDWRDKAGSMEMIAAHAVNVPGFEVKPSVGVVDGVQVSLVAAGALDPALQMLGEVVEFDSAGIAAAVVDEMEHRAEMRAEAKALAERFNGELAGSLRARFGGQ